MMRAIVFATALSSLLGACSSASEGGESAPPTIQISSPERGTFVDGGTVEVRGTVQDDQPGVKVSINGTEIIPASDGSFSATISVTSGVSIIETKALDKSNQTSRDVRAVMAGAIQVADGSLSSPLGARVGTQGFMALGGALGTAVGQYDIKTAALAMNPIMNDTDCNGAVINIEDITIGQVDVGLTPSAGKVTANVAIHDVYVKAHVHFRALCVGGSTTVELTSTVAHVDGDLALAVQGGKIAASLPGSAVNLEGFEFDASGVPGFVEDMFDGKVRDKIEEALLDAVQNQVPQLANESLSGLLAQPISVDVSGHAVTLTANPNELTISPEGLFASVNTKVTVAGGEGAMYVSRPMPLSSSLMPTTGVGLAIADDTINQLFAGLWGAGVIDMNLPLDGQLAILASLLDNDAASLQVRAALPPTLSGDADSLHLAIGDLMLTVKDYDGNEIQNIALSVKTSLAAQPSATGALKLTVGDPELFAQVISQTDTVDRKLTDEQFEGIVNGAWGIIGQQADSALSGLTMPSLMGVTLGSPSLVGRAGFVVGDVPVN